ncbi:DUF6232 family protein [Hyalangium sp.]|uniref:DUF6232 family protein n=1 Tax=Hyalangium sp. TaxID=2028555 RepID=UPI002D235C83|nr:DUF6232 family protein [Hyalangium sp.]HYH98392.1 DUF6232 family protein [Hyalangium sp.]
MSDSASHLSTSPLSPREVRGTEPGESETTIFDDQGVLVTSERVVIAGRTWLLGDVEGVDSIHRSPRVLPWLVTLTVGVVVGLPMLLSAMATPAARDGELYEAALVLASAAIFGSIAALLLMGDTYWLVLRTRQSEGRVLRSRDPQLISNLVAVVAKAAAARQRH